MKTTIVRIRNPKAIGLLWDFLIPTSDMPIKHDVANHLEGLLENYPTNCYFSIAIDEATDTIEMFILSFNQPGTTKVFGIQTWISPKIETWIQTKMYDLYFAWADANGMTSIVIDSVRHPPHPNFKLLYSISEFNLTKEPENADSTSSDLQHFDQPAATNSEQPAEQHSQGGNSDGPVSGRYDELHQQIRSDTVADSV